MSGSLQDILDDAPGEVDELDSIGGTPSQLPTKYGTVSIIDGSLLGSLTNAKKTLKLHANALAFLKELKALQDNYQGGNTPMLVF